MSHWINGQNKTEVFAVSTLALGVCRFGLGSVIAQKLHLEGFESNFIKDPNYPGSGMDALQNQEYVESLSKGDVTIYLETKTVKGKFFLMVIFIGPTYPRRDAYKIVESIAKEVL